MTISKIKITNFKSFDEEEVELGKFNVLIGANASGKSNFVHIFQFLKDLSNHGLDNAISMQGGVEYLRNINIGMSKDFSVVVTSHQQSGIGLRQIAKRGIAAIKINETVYDFALKFAQEGSGFDIVRDRMLFKCEFLMLQHTKAKIEEKEKLGFGDIELSRLDGKVNIELRTNGEVPITKKDIYPQFLTGQQLPPHELLLEAPAYFMQTVKSKFKGISICDFDPKLPKKATPITGKAELEEDGSNLAIVLKNIKENPEKIRKFSNLLKDILPFIDNLDVEKFADKSLLFKLKEKYCKSQYVPASLISDGTINVTALIISLYFEEKPIIIVEEPERNIHPYLISKTVNMMKDASQKKQIIITTHNPEVIKHAGLDNIFLVFRDSNCFSRVAKPSQKEQVKTFLSNEIGIEDLYVQNLLEV